MKLRPLFGDRRVRRHGDPSGLAVAERAYERGRATPALPLPLCDVRIELAVHGTPEHADAVAASLAYRLGLRSDVNLVTYSVIERP